MRTGTKPALQCWHADDAGDGNHRDDMNVENEDGETPFEMLDMDGKPRAGHMLRISRKGRKRKLKGKGVVDRLGRA
jgi:hypothetical protein